MKALFSVNRRFPDKNLTIQKSCECIIFRSQYQTHPLKKSCIKIGKSREKYKKVKSLNNNCSKSLQKNAQNLSEYLYKILNTVYTISRKKYSYKISKTYIYTKSLKILHKISKKKSQHHNENPRCQFEWWPTFTLVLAFILLLLFSL